MRWRIDERLREDLPAAGLELGVGWGWGSACRSPATFQAAAQKLTPMPAGGSVNPRLFLLAAAYPGWACVCVCVCVCVCMHACI